jgi:hypothetical protein
LGLGAARFRAAGLGTAAGWGAAAFFAGLLLALAFLADFFGAAALDFLADFFAGFLADFFEAFFEAFLADFFFAVRTFFFLSFLPFLLFFPLAIVILLVAADQCPSGVSS